eukprot:CAMPEP_0114341072 /NCGR_PEP_ID=MMETSP0101-20121206/8800_1 /TAXON_ID=38822 ORGANISM="Pteridomonas danica, Strain PT" /NCGR_SAMPLE_ID=MMETSP0101 /ASSEMBLY_ACC=CAM_ASM_000211 /LENGTH=140 /DNA_ID=CAMNT_0001474547 /DNA_START=848 /DNA_END=1267 /DNA_ORIENTATION=+
MLFLSNGTSASSTSTSPLKKRKDDKEEKNKELELLGKGWERCYQCASGLTYYKNNETYDVIYDDGGSTAIFEETDIDLVKLGDGVFLGPSFKVISDRSDEFVDMWGQSFNKKATFGGTGGFDQFELEVALDAALSNEYCW